MSGKATKHEFNIREAWQPLRLIAFGAIIVIIDIRFGSTTNGRGIQFDIVNDVIGMLMILSGIFRLAKFKVGAQYSYIFQFLKVMTVLGCIDAALGHFVFGQTLPTQIAVLSILFGTAKLVAVFLFCVAMLLLSEHYSLPRSRINWLTTLKFMTIFWIVPLGLMHAVSLYTILFGGVAYLNVGILIVPIFALMLIPVLHLFSSINQMMYESGNGLSAGLPAIK